MIFIYNLNVFSYKITRRTHKKDKQKKKDEEREREKDGGKGSSGSETTKDCMHDVREDFKTLKQAKDTLTEKEIFIRRLNIVEF